MSQAQIVEPDAGGPLLPEVLVVVLNWNNSADTLQCVQSLLGLDHDAFAVLVCDNQSRPEDLARTRAWGHHLPGGLPEVTAGEACSLLPLRHQSVTLVHTGGNLGFAGGVNVGLRIALSHSGVTHVWVLNNDTVVEKGALRAMLARMALHERIGICGSTLIYEGDRTRVQAWGGARYEAWRGRSMAIGAFTAIDQVPSDPTAVEAQLAYVIGASMLVTRTFLETVGLMDERYFLYSEEHDWAERGRRLGFRLAYAPAARVYHRHGATIGTSASGGSDLSLHYLYRNKARFAAKHHPISLPLVLLCLIYEAVKFALKGSPTKAVAALGGLAQFLLGRSGPTFGANR